MPRSRDVLVALGLDQQVEDLALGVDGAHGSRAPIAVVRKDPPDVG
jgi:hypothetical protein